MRTARSLAVVFSVMLAAPGCGDDRFSWQVYDACEAGQAPDEACFRERRAPSSQNVQLATAIAIRFMDEHPPESLAWNWEEGVLMFALTELRRVTGAPTYQAYYRDWIDHHRGIGYQIVWSDSCPPGLTAHALAREPGADPAYGAVVDEILAYLDDDALRTPEGGISHMGTIDLFGPTLWLDSLFMFGMLLNRVAEDRQDAARLDQMGEQIAIFADALQDPGGLLVHASNWPDPQDPDVYWARGNGWVTAAGYDYLRVRAHFGGRDRDVEAILAAQVDALVASQDPQSGLWWTVINRPGETYVETSASALFAYGLARAWRYGFQDDAVLPVIATALDGIRDRVVDDGQGRPIVTEISGPTGVGGFDNYAGIPLEDDIPYGVGAVILALIETSGLPL